MNQIQPASTEVFSFPLSVILIPILLGIALGVFGVICVRKRMSKRLGIGLLAGAVIAEGIFAAGMAVDRISVSPQEIIVRTGFWFAPTHEGFAYRDVSYIQKTVVRLPNGHEFPTWEVHYLDGKVADIELTDLWMRNQTLIEQLVAGYGVVIKN